MTPAEQALANAIHCEMVKCAYRQSKDGIVVSLVVHPDEVPAGLATSKLGTRYMVALVQIGDDELPVQKESRPAPRQEIQPQPDGAKRMDWREVQPAAQAGIRCGDPAFRAFLMEQHSYRPRDRNDTEEAAVFIRGFFGINSRSELGTDHRKRVLWKQLDDQFQAWKAVEHA